jgi:hypothetical protein
MKKLFSMLLLLSFVFVGFGNPTNLPIKKDVVQLELTTKKIVFTTVAIAATNKEFKSKAEVDLPSDRQIQPIGAALSKNVNFYSTLNTDTMYSRYNYWRDSNYINYNYYNHSIFATNYFYYNFGNYLIQ